MLRIQEHRVLISEDVRSTPAIIAVQEASKAARSKHIIGAAIKPEVTGLTRAPKAKGLENTGLEDIIGARMGTRAIEYTVVYRCIRCMPNHLAAIE